MSKLKVKVCGMKQAENIKSMLAIRPDLIGFIFFPGSKRYIGIGVNFQGLDILTSDIKKVGVFVNDGIEKTVGIFNEYKLDFAQLHGTESADYCRHLKETGVSIIKAFGINKKFDFSILESYLPYCGSFLFDTKTYEYGGSGYKFNWEILKKYNYDIPFILSGGIGPEDAEIIRQMEHPQLYAVDINSRFETEPGLKDIKKVETFINKIRRNEIYS